MSPVHLNQTALWPDEGPLPDDWSVNWAGLKDRLRETDEGWDWWIDWYEGIIRGRVRDQDLELKVIKIPDEIWKEGPKALNAEIAHLDSGGTSRIAVSETPELADQEVELERLAARLTTLEKAEADLTSMPAKVKDLGDLLEELSESEAQTSESLKNLSKEHDAEIERTRAERERLAEYFGARASKEYLSKLWKAKQEGHRKSGETAEARFQVGLGVTAGFAVVVLGMIISGSSWLDPFFGAEGAFTGKTAVGIGALLTVFTAMLWFTRLQLKVWLAERHLALDAQEREAFVQAYLAMLAGDLLALTDQDFDERQQEQLDKFRAELVDATKEQRQIIYAALFRPGQDGIIREEAGLDPAITAALSKFLAKP